MAKPASSARPRNQLLSALSDSDFGLLQPNLEFVDLPLRYDLEKSNKPIKHVYFIEAGIASVVAEGARERIEVGLIGREGMSGATIVLGDRRSPHSTYMQAAGEGQRIKVGELRTAMQASESLRGLFLKCVQAFMTQTAHTAVANGRATLAPRLARWILMAHDRLEACTLPLSHEFLSLMLGVRRAGVTDTLNILEGEKLIRASRGQIQVLNRKGLEERAKDSYGLPEAEYRRLIG
jgi:CRP-like cAMP-binding protein